MTESFAPVKIFHLGGREHVVGGSGCCPDTRPCGIDGCPGLIHSQYLGEVYDEGLLCHEYDDCCDVCG